MASERNHNLEKENKIEAMALFSLDCIEINFALFIPCSVSLNATLY
jgi:hypothetical protein